MPTPKQSPHGPKQQLLLSFFQPSLLPLKERSANVESGGKTAPLLASGKAALLLASGKAAPQSLPLRKPAATPDTTLDGEGFVTCMETPGPGAAQPPLSPLRRTHVSYAESESEEEVVGRKRRVVESDSEEEFRPGGESSDDEVSEGVAESEPESASSEEEEEKKPKKAAKRTPASTPAAKRTSTSTPAATPHRLLLTAHTSSPIRLSPLRSSPAGGAGKHAAFNKSNEERYSWIVNELDAAKRPPSHPEHDPRTLYVPPSAWAQFSPFEKQYWGIKSKMWDTVVFFKKGKFYEVYEKDADEAARRFGLRIAGGGRANMRLAGVPEMSFGYWARQFVEAGFKVARVDQAELALAHAMAGNKGIVERKLTCVLTAGTLTDPDMVVGESAVYCVAVAAVDGATGLAWIDTSTGEAGIGSYDDAALVDTALARLRPAEVVWQRSSVPAGVARAVRAHAAPQCVWNNVGSGEWWGTAAALARVEEVTGAVPREVGEAEPAGAAAFAGLVGHLAQLLLDKEVLPLARFDAGATSALVLDGTTLHNLEVFANTHDGSVRGSVLGVVDRGHTAFGRRALRRWLAAPPASAAECNARLDSVEWLMAHGEEREVLGTMLRGLPDLERMVARIHGGSLGIREFVRVVEAFEAAAAVVPMYAEAPGALGAYARRFPELGPALAVWDAVDRTAAATGTVVTAAGFDQEMDASAARIGETEGALEELLQEYRRTYSPQVCLRDSGKELCLIEVPVKAASAVPRDWTQMSATSKVKRFWLPAVKRLAQRLAEERESHKAVVAGARARLYARWVEDAGVYAAAVAAVGAMDCVGALATASEEMSPSVRPEFVEAPRAALSFSELRHPCVAGCVPNDISLGGEGPLVGLLTGANAAGKSTILRMTCVAVVLGQLGCYVPAREARMTVVDRIMTRLGASDAVLQGHSTFEVELAETQRMVARATPRLVVIVDELGRGGSLTDGFAVAEAVLHELATHTHAAGFFATHFLGLVGAFAHHPAVRAVRMAVRVEGRALAWMYRLEEGQAEGSFGTRVAEMCGVAPSVVARAEEVAARGVQTGVDVRGREGVVPLGVQSDFVGMLKGWSSGDMARSVELVKAMVGGE